MKEYKNYKGIIEDVLSDNVIIDSEMVLVDTPKSRKIFDISRADIGDSVEYNINVSTGELIFIKVINRKSDTKKSRYVERYDSDSEDRVCGYYRGGGEMANMCLASHDPYDEWADGDTM